MLLAQIYNLIVGLYVKTLRLSDNRENAPITKGRMCSGSLHYFLRNFKTAIKKMPDPIFPQLQSNRNFFISDCTKNILLKEFHIMKDKYIEMFQRAVEYDEEMLSLLKKILESLLLQRFYQFSIETEIVETKTTEYLELVDREGAKADKNEKIFEKYLLTQDNPRICLNRADLDKDPLMQILKKRYSDTPNIDSNPQFLEDVTTCFTDEFSRSKKNSKIPKRKRNAIYSKNKASKEKLDELKDNKQGNTNSSSIKIKNLTNPTKNNEQEIHKIMSSIAKQNILNGISSDLILNSTTNANDKVNTKQLSPGLHSNPSIRFNNHNLLN